MANWKKMAEAFGRAVNSPAATARGQELVNKSKIAKSGPERQAYEKGYAEAERINAAAIDDLGEGLDDVERVGKYRDEVEDAYTDKRLRDTRKDEWDDAFRHAEDVMELPDDEMNEVLRSLIKELKPRGFTEQDILNSLRSLGEK